ncbi:MAG TPA: 3',5'-nucleoside bisphosphate phosphatase [Noviherbaspirillum sp.]|uniref:3',5'-nucleoside bisphosphate phosphatase n=1 Tax=Noviherbaspirillum sp. TaxID=1926288 RepID=UPI002D2DF487|nr:3',5'-nucleoside bisphosphate phosphatase [Noviherbaspirillum sp.]HYD97063.1 3',5'-nucleoside bisphosphate phosphatase [Noviherbaspirillum sp.]
MLNVDLHCHSNVSDGALAPAEVAARAKAGSVDVWALTDHDEIGGIAEAREAAAALGMRYVTGVEISVTWAGRTIHVVGLRFDENNRDLAEGLKRTRCGREQRAHEMAAQLAAVGIPDAFEGALKHVGNPDLISRTHFARYIIETGACKDVQEVFANYLIEGKPGYVPHRWATLRDAVSWIRGAGGIAVVAHPGRYDLSDLELDALLSEFKQLGGAGVEVVTGSHTVDEYARFARIAQQYGLLASRGSDFHAPGESQTELGALPALPPNLTPVWHDWAV